MGRGQKKAQAQGQRIVFLDETGFMLQPVVRRSWAPRGQPPVQYSWDRHDRLSVIGALVVSSGGRLEWHYAVHRANLRAEAVQAFLDGLHQKVGGSLWVVLDRFSVHRKAVRVLQESGCEWLSVSWLPAYAPELNPVELAWCWVKYGVLANFLALDVEHLARAVEGAFGALRVREEVLRSCVAWAGLELEGVFL